MRLRTLSLVFAGLLLPLALACGGSSSSSSATASSTPAKSLAYSDPSGPGWRLVKDASSTSTRIVLDLVGPSGLMTRGVGFNLQASAKLKFGTFANGLPINDTGVYQLLSAAADPNEPVALIGGVKPGNLLSVGIYQKDRAQSAQDSGSPLCQIAVVLDPALGISAGDKLPFQVVKAKAIPEDIGSVTDDLWTLNQKTRMTDITVATGTLSAK